MSSPYLQFSNITKDHYQIESLLDRLLSPKLHPDARYRCQQRLGAFLMGCLTAVDVTVYSELVKRLGSNSTQLILSHYKSLEEVSPHI